MELAGDLGAVTIWPDGDGWRTTGTWGHLIGLTRHEPSRSRARHGSGRTK